MPMDLSTLHSWLERRYRGIGLTLTTEATPDQPLWHVQETVTDKADLFDRELGIWIQFHVVVDPAAAELCVEEAVREGLEQVSRLDPKSSVPTDREDRLGMWQMHVIWLVELRARQAWSAALAELRARSGHTEELGLDVVEVRDSKLDQALDDVIHGPNGSGKSSLFEALSLALFGTSHRLCEYMRDTDIKPADRARYAELVLRRFGADGDAVLKLGSKNRLTSIANSKDDAQAREAASRGTLLAQETAREFVTLNASERAIGMLGDYSRFANRTQQELDSVLASDKAAWQETLRSLELNASITKRETIHNRLARRLIDGKAPKASDTIEQWLKTLGSLRSDFAEEAGKLALRWARVDTPAARDELSEKLGVSVLLVDEGPQTSSSWLAERRHACQAPAALAVKVSEALRPVEKEWGGIQSDIETWANWTHSRRQREAKQPTPASPDATASIDVADAEVQRKLADGLRELEATGKLLRGQFEHLQSTTTDLMPLCCCNH